MTTNIIKAFEFNRKLSVYLETCQEWKARGTVSLDFSGFIWNTDRAAFGEKAAFSGHLGTITTIIELSLNVPALASPRVSGDSDQHSFSQSGSNRLVGLDTHISVGMLPSPLRDDIGMDIRTQGFLSNEQDITV